MIKFQINPRRLKAKNTLIIFLPIFIHDFLSFYFIQNLILKGLSKGKLIVFFSSSKLILNFKCVNESGIGQHTYFYD
jgi:hypothetical protein